MRSASSLAEYVVSAATRVAPLTSIVTRQSGPTDAISVTGPSNWFLAELGAGDVRAIRISSARMIAWHGPAVAAPATWIASRPLGNTAAPSSVVTPPANTFMA